MASHNLTVHYVPLASLQPYARNARTHSPAQLAKLEASLMEYGWTVPMAVAGKDILAGHGRLAAALSLAGQGKTVPGLDDPSTAPVIDLSHLSAKQRRAYILADNRLALDAGWDGDLLKGELDALLADDFDLSLTGFDPGDLEALLADQPPPSTAVAGSLAARFGLPPFTVLSAREGWWQERKRAWVGLGIRSDLGRGEDIGLDDGSMAFSQKGINAWQKANPRKAAD